MAMLQGTFAGLAEVARANRHWITWNLTLAFVPAVLAVVLFGRARARHGYGWWLGVVTFVLFLPNAPYVVTDLVHLRGDVLATRSDVIVLAGVLPMYAGFVFAGFLAYVVSLDLLRAEVRRRRPSIDGPWLELGVHAVCSLGIVLGRIARLNSWDVATTPVGTLERALTTLSWRGAPFAFVCVFVAVTLTYAVVHALTTSFLRRKWLPWQPLPTQNRLFGD
jgi:uncharacterized membrane protein